MSDDEIGIELENPAFNRGGLAAAEQAVIMEVFASDVAAVRGRINDGKEATVYLCEGHDNGEPCGEPCGEPYGGLFAAKMYRARKFRAFANDSAYLDVQGIRDRRLRKAIRKRSKVGRRTPHHQWVDREWQVLGILHAHGASMPEPRARAAMGILMEYNWRTGRPGADACPCHARRSRAATRLRRGRGRPQGVVFLRADPR